jgi:hypothetical protein
MKKPASSNQPSDRSGSDEISAQRRRAAKLALYTAPAIIGTLFIAREAKAQPSCQPASCFPWVGPCQPQSCEPRN